MVSQAKQKGRRNAGGLREKKSYCLGGVVVPVAGFFAGVAAGRVAVPVGFTAEGAFVAGGAATPEAAL